MSIAGTVNASPIKVEVWKRERMWRTEGPKERPGNRPG